jgi:cytochrome P450
MRLLPALIRATTPVLFIPAVAPLRFTPLRRRVDALIYAEIDERRREADPDRQDILSLLLTVEDDAGQRLDDTELRDELMTLLFAGHETTATALSWAVALLVHHPHTMVALRADLATGNDAYLRAVIRETHRLRPTVPNVVRKASSRVEIGRWTLTPGCVATPAIHLLHRRADCYPQPDRFLPERWLGDSPADGAPWLPFGGGTRRCIGAAFADMEMQEVLKVVIEQVRLVAAARGIDRPRRRTVTTVPGSGVRVLIRNPSA